jgi:hypothetical protein
MIVITGLDPVIHPLRKKLVTKIELTVHDFATVLNTVRHCELREAIHGAASEVWIASSQVLLAMTARHGFAISPHGFFARGILYSRPLQ